MSQDLQSIDVATIPELARLADEVERTGRPWALWRGPRTVAVVVPAPSTLDTGYQSIPALDPPREWDEVVQVPMLPPLRTGRSDQRHTGHIRGYS